MSIASASPKLIVVSARSKSRASPITDKIAAAYPNVKVEILEMDLGSLASVRNAAMRLDSALDVLICNAAIMAVPYGKTEDGFEKQFGVNHLGHFLFTNLLLKEGKIRNGGRIVVVSSDGHRLSDVLWEDPGFQVSSTVGTYDSGNGKQY
jgi:NAD(P)-dependent dehydrogenase (short-subunit alcohol dehydrogenase family)